MLSELLHSFGDGLCHQIPDRTLTAMGLYYPVCSRCTGIYIGFIVALTALFLLYRTNQRKGSFGWQFYLVAAAASLGMLFDVSSAYLDLRETNNFIRLTTGVLFGSSLAAVAYLMLVDSLAARGSRDRVLSDGRGVAGWLAGAAATVLTVYFALPYAGPVGPVLTAVAIIATFASVATALVGLAPRYRHSVASVTDAIWPVGLGLVIGSAAVALAKATQYGLERLAGL